MTPMMGGLIVLGIAVVAFMYMTTKSAPLEVIREALKSGAKVIDVRTSGEFGGGHFPGAVNIPVDQIAARLDKLGDTSQQFILYCHSGMRSGSARRILKKSGFNSVINGGSLHHMMSLAGE